MELAGDTMTRDSHSVQHRRPRADSKNALTNQQEENSDALWSSSGTLIDHALSLHHINIPAIQRLSKKP